MSIAETAAETFDADAGLGFTPSGQARVLVVDDDPMLLRSVERIFGDRYALQVEESPYAALVALEEDGPFAVILSDLTMPGVDGIELLEHARDMAPETLRILLTGNADLPSAVEAVNRSRISSFLTKPVDPDELIGSIDAAIEEHRGMLAERATVEETLHGSAEALLEVLSIANPVAHRRARRIQELTDQYLERHPTPRAWDIKMAAALCQIGAAAIDPQLSNRIAGNPAGIEVSEALLVGCVPAFTMDIVSRIPRLSNVEDILRFHWLPSGTALACDPKRDRYPFGARLLHILTAVAEYESVGDDRETVAGKIRADKVSFDPGLVSAVLDLYLPVGDRQGRQTLADDVIVDLD